MSEKMSAEGISADEYGILSQFGHPHDPDYDDERLAHRVLSFPNTDANWFVASAVSLAAAFLQERKRHDDACVSLLAARGEIERADATIGRLTDEVYALQREADGMREALEPAEAWLDRWAEHVGNCRGMYHRDECTCGLTAVRSEARAALNGPPLIKSKMEPSHD